MGPISRVSGTFLKLCLVGHLFIVPGSLALEEASEFQQVLQDEVIKIPIENFIEDPELLQKVDEEKGITSYSLTGDDSTSVYERNSLDEGKDVIVLSSEEDQFLFKNLKRRFVVLRKKADNTYYATYAYLRDALDENEDRVVKINGSLWTIEWDTWDYRGPGKDRFQTFGFSNCGPSTIVPCGYNSEVGKEAGNNVEPLSVRTKWTPTSDFLNSPPEIKLTRFVTEPGFDINDNFDLYGDLEVTKGGSGRSISKGNSANLDSDEVKPRFDYEKIPAWAGGPSKSSSKKNVTVQNRHRASAVSQTFLVTDQQQASGRYGPKDTGDKKKGDSEREPEFGAFETDSSDEQGARKGTGHFRQSKDKTYDADSHELTEDSEFINDYEGDGGSSSGPKNRKTKKITISQRLKQSISIVNTTETEVTSEEITSPDVLGDGSDGGYGGATVAGFFRGGWSSPKVNAELNNNADGPPDNNADSPSDNNADGSSDDNADGPPKDDADETPKEDADGSSDNKADGPPKDNADGPIGPPDDDIGGRSLKYSYTGDAPPATVTETGNNPNPVLLKVPTDFSPDEPAGVIFCGFLSAFPNENCTEPIFFQPKPAFLEHAPRVPTHGTMVDLNYTFARTGTLKYTEQFKGDVATEEINQNTIDFEWKWQFFPDSDGPSDSEAPSVGSGPLQVVPYGVSDPDTEECTSTNTPDTSDGSKNEPSGTDSNTNDSEGKESGNGNPQAKYFRHNLPKNELRRKSDSVDDGDNGNAVTRGGSKPPSENVPRLEDLNFGFPVDFKPDDSNGDLFPGFISLLPISNTTSSFFQPGDPSAKMNESVHGTLIDKSDSSETPGTLEFTEVWETQENATAYEAEFNSVPYRFEWKWEFFPDSMEDSPRRRGTPEGRALKGKPGHKEGEESTTAAPSEGEGGDNAGSGETSSTSEDPSGAEPSESSTPASNDDTSSNPEETEGSTEEPSETAMLSGKHEENSEKADDTEGSSTVVPDASDDQSTADPSADSTGSKEADDMLSTQGTSRDSNPSDDSSTTDSPSSDSNPSDDSSSTEQPSSDSNSPDDSSSTEQPSSDSNSPDDSSSTESPSSDSNPSDDSSSTSTEGPSPDTGISIGGQSGDSEVPGIEEPSDESPASLGRTYAKSKNTPKPKNSKTAMKPQKAKPSNNKPGDSDTPSDKSTDSDSPSDKTTDSDTPIDQPTDSDTSSDKSTADSDTPSDDKPTDSDTSSDKATGTSKAKAKSSEPDTSKISPSSTKEDSDPSDISVQGTATAEVKAKGMTIANSISNTGFAGANAVDRVGLGAEATAVNGSKANANALTVKGGDALATSDTYGVGGAHSNAMSVTKGKAIGTALSRGTGNSSAIAFSKDSGAQANSITSQGGNSRANAVSGGDGDSLGSSAALQGGSSVSSAVATGTGVAKSNSLAQGGGDSKAVADAQKGGSALATSRATDGGNSHSIATAVGNGTSISNSVSQGGGRTQADAIADDGDSVANAVQDDSTDETFDVSMFEANLNDVSDQNFLLLSQQARGFDHTGKGAHRSIQWNQDDGPTNPNAYLTGWKTQYEAIEPKVTFEHEDEIFYGLASCPYKESNPNEIDSAFHPDDYISFYTAYLRSWCMMNEFEKIKTLISDGALLAKDKVMVVPLDSKFATEAKLTSHQLDELAMAFELDVFTNLFIEQRDQAPDPVSRSPSKTPISRSCRFFVDFLLRGLDQSRKLKPHYVRLTRQLILIAKVAYTKLLQDFDILDPCHECSEDKARNLYDRIEIMAVIEFMMKGLSPLDKSPTPCAETAFTKFFELNQGAIEIRVNTFAS